MMKMIALAWLTAVLGITCARCESTVTLSSFLQWTATHAKTYRSGAEFKASFEAFSRNDAAIRAAVDSGAVRAN